MSTKTLRKRIALVAVSALGFGLVGAAPSTASPTTLSINNGGVFVAGGNIDVTITLGVTVANNLTVFVAQQSPNGFLPGDDDRQYGGATLGDIPAGITATNLVIDRAANTLTNANNTNASTLVIPSSMLLPGVYRIGIDGNADAAAALTAANAAATAGTDTISFTVLPAVAAGAITATADAPWYTSTANNQDATIVVSKPAGLGALRARVLTAPATAVNFIPGYVNSAAGLIVTDLVGAGAAATGSQVTVRYNTTAGANVLSTLGTYGIQIWADANADGLVTTGEISTTVSLTFGGAATATGSSISLSRSLTTFVADNTAGSLGQSNTETLGNAAGVLDNFRVTVTCADTDGNPATCTPTLNESVDESSIAANQAMTRVGNTNTYIFDAATTSAGDATAGFTDSIVTLRLDGTVTTKTATYKNVYLADLLTRLTATDAVGVGSVGALGKQDLFDAAEASTAALPVATAVAVDRAVTSITYTVTAPATEAGRYVVTLRRPAAVGTSLTVAPEVATIRRLGSDAMATWAEAVTGAAADSYTINVLGRSGTGATATANAAIAVTYATATPAITVTPTSTVLAKDGATTSFAGVLADQFGRPIAAGNVFWSVAGRNPATGSVVTGTDGSIPSVTVVDASKIVTAAAVGTTAATVNTDTITFTYNYSVPVTGAAASVTGSRGVTYSLTGPSVATVAVASATTAQAIDQAKVAGTPAATVTYTATVRKADSTSSGTGILCTWAGGAGDLFLNGINTSVTNADGLCTISAFRDTVGSSAITATAVGVTSNVSAPVRYLNRSGSSAAGTADGTFHDGRYIAVTAGTAVAGTPVTVLAKVTDRFGSAVAGVQVTFSLSGVGRLVAGDSLLKSTDSNGQAQIQVVASDNETGTNTVSASFAGSQANDIAGFVSVITGGTVVPFAIGNGATSTATAGVTAAVRAASATVTFTKNTSTSTADALLALAQALGTRDQASAAIDAAAEATDASNAATDAANAAAEAADAATAAAQDAADAVAALSTQVSEMVAALKKQITSLTNLVIKIQRKVRA
jgi:trimeric autotransporter adhesin